jgi:hypothetical protein
MQVDHRRALSYVYAELHNCTTSASLGKCHLNLKKLDTGKVGLTDCTKWENVTEMSTRNLSAGEG